MSCRHVALPLLLAASVTAWAGPRPPVDPVIQVAPGFPLCFDPAELAASGSAWTQRACQELDGQRRPQDDRREYRLRTLDVGAHTLTLGVRRTDAASAELLQTFEAPLLVQAVDPLLPRLELIRPAPGAPLVLFTEAGFERVPFGWQPLEVWATAPNGVARVSVVVDGAEQVLRPVDGTRFRLEAQSCTTEILNRVRAANQELHCTPTQNYLGLAGGHPIDRFIVEHAGGASEFGAPAPNLFIDDPAPELEIVAPPRVDMAKGDQLHVGVRVRDAGRNVRDVVAYWRDGCEIRFDEAEPPAGSECLAVGGVRMGDEEQWYGALHVDEFQLRVPYRPPYLAPASSAELCLVAYDHDGHHSVPACSDQQLAAPLAGPFVGIEPPAFRVPPGERIPVGVVAEHLGLIESVEVSLLAEATSIDQEVVAAGTVNALEQTVWLDMPADALVGTAFTVRAQVRGEGGTSRTASALVFAGEWGERTVVVDGYTEAGPDLLYADVVVQAGAALQVNDTTSRFNRLVVQNGGHARIGSPDPAALGLSGAVWRLELHEALQIDAGGRIDVAPHDLGRAELRGAHGGDNSALPGAAYDNFREPRFPGAASGPGVNESIGGGALEIVAPAVEIDGTLAADGLNHWSSSYGGAGGSLLIRSNAFTGTGMLSARGGEGGAAGAGGRIAVVADTLARDPATGLPAVSFDVAPGGPAGASGTAYVRDANSTWGELYLSSATTASTTPLGGIGRHAIGAIESLGANRYRVHLADGAAWSPPDVASWSSGLLGLDVSLDAADRDAPLYRVVGNGVDTLDIEAPQLPVPAAGAELLGVVRLDRIVIGDGVRLRSPDRIYAGAFELTDAGSLDDVAEARSDRVIEIDAYVNDSAGEVLVADLSAGSLQLLGAGAVTRIHGEVSVAGGVEVGAGARFDVLGSLAAGSLAIEGGALDARDSVSTLHDAVVSDGGRIAADVVAIGGDLYVSSAVVEATHLLTVRGRTRATAGAVLRSGAEMRFGADVRVDAATLRAREIFVDALADLVVDHGGVVSARNRLAVSGSLLGASFAEIHAARLEAPFTQLDGETGEVRLRTSVWRGDTGVLLDTLLRPWSGVDGTEAPDAGIDVELARTSYVGTGSTIDVAGVASLARHPDRYPACALAGSARHAGAGVEGPDVTGGCAYGRYERPAWPGLEGPSAGSFGGGVLDIEAGSIVLRGQITADGAAGGAGGSVRLVATNATGAGVVRARGAGAGSVRGSGGRIAVIADNWSRLTLDLDAAPPDDAGTGAAGTIFVADAESTPGLLRLSGGDPAAPPSQPGAVGRHAITSVALRAPDRWRIEAAGAQWLPSSGPDRGLTGRSFLPDVDDAGAPLFTIVANGADWLEITGTVDPTAWVGHTLAGQQVLETFAAPGGARADFAGDRVLILDEESAAQFDWSLHNATPP